MTRLTRPGDSVTVDVALAFGRARLVALGDEGRFDALRLLEEILDRSASWILAHGGDALDDAVAAHYVAGIERRAAGEPVAYVVGNAGFYGRTFAVTPDVLVPRPETELLVGLALDALRGAGIDAPNVCDVGTGSGILAITLACELPAARVLAIDVSPGALAVALRNAAAQGVAERIDFRCGDGARVLASCEATFDCIVANLPYVRRGDLAALPRELAFEPVVALDGGESGLEVYADVLSSVRARLRPRGVLVMEAGADTTEALAALAAERFGAAAHVHVHRDYGGRPRAVDVRFARS